jgi:hypothetical protein
MYQPSPLVSVVGRIFFRIVRRFPWIAAILFIGGLVLGYCFVFVLHDDRPAKEWFLRIIGVGCLILYSGFLIALLRKLINGTWKNYCDQQIAIFARRPRE